MLPCSWWLQSEIDLVDSCMPISEYCKHTTEQSQTKRVVEAL